MDDTKYTDNENDDDSYKLDVFTGLCPFSLTKVVFRKDSIDVDCPNCNVAHPVDKLHDVNQLKIKCKNTLQSLVKSLLSVKKSLQESKNITQDFVVVNNLSNFHCKLISPLLTYYGMHKQSGKAVRLKDLFKAEPFQCSLLADRAFRINSDRIEILGYGRDRGGSMEYLKVMLQVINQLYDEEIIIPVHVDGDGHCLVHAISRALVGNELFWHPLRINLKLHLKSNHARYRSLLGDFISNDEWHEIIAEADPDFTPKNGESLGLRNIHIFALANVLQRPILLLDNLEGLQSSGDYSAVFLPALLPIAECKGKDGRLYKPVALAWSSPARNHFVPLVGVEGRPQPKIPRQILPNVWAIRQDLINDYIEFDINDYCTIGGDRALPENYIQKLAKAMDELYFQKDNVVPELIENFYRQLSNDVVTDIWLRPREIATITGNAVRESRLLQCLSCTTIIEHSPQFPQSHLKYGGPIYELARRYYGDLIPNKVYKLQMHRYASFSYDPIGNCLFVLKTSRPDKCPFCLMGQLREVDGRGNIAYRNGDKTRTPSDPKLSHCCEYKHYWNDREYDNLPEIIPITFEWHGSIINSEFAWFENESDPNNNSNAYQIANELVQRYFPGEFGSELLVQQLVSKIFDIKKNCHRVSEPQPDDMTHKKSSQGALRNDATYSFPLRQETTQVKGTSETVEARIAKEQATSQFTSIEDTNCVDKLKKQRQKDIRKGSTSSSNRSVTTECDKTEISKKIRVSTPDNGKNVMITINSSTSLKDLQKKIQVEFGIPMILQRLRYGFPPTELDSADYTDDKSLPIRGGEKVIVESIASTSKKVGVNRVVTSSCNIAGKDEHEIREAKEVNANRDTDNFQRELSNVCDDGNNTFSIQLDSCIHSLQDDLSGAYASGGGGPCSVGQGSISGNHNTNIGTSSKAFKRAGFSEYDDSANQNTGLLHSIIKQRVEDVTSSIAKKKVELSEIVDIMKKAKTDDDKHQLSSRRRAIKAALEVLERELKITKEKQKSLHTSSK